MRVIWNAATRRKPATERLDSMRDHDQVDVVETAHNWSLARDRLHWRIILSPDDVDRIDRAEQHMRDVMAQMEKDLGTQAQMGSSRARQYRASTTLIFCCAGCGQEYDRNGKCRDSHNASRVCKPRHSGNQRGSSSSGNWDHEPSVNIWRRAATGSRPNAGRKSTGPSSRSSKMASRIIVLPPI